MCLKQRLDLDIEVNLYLFIHKSVDREKMKERDIVQNAFNHIEGKIPVDLGSVMTTGIHVSCVAELRKYYGLDEHPVKVIEVCQMLGEVEDDLKEVLGVNTQGVFGLSSMYGFENKDYKEWRAPWGQDVLVPGKFVVREDSNGNGIVVYPGGDEKARPSGHLPDGGFFFDTIIRQEDYDEDELDELDPELNTEEFGDFTKEDLDHYESSVDAAYESGRSVVLNFSGASLGDIALVPAPFLKDPKGIRDIEEWYISTAIRDDYVNEIFKVQAEISLRNFQALFDRVGNKIDAIFICGTDFGTQCSTFCSPEKFNDLWAPHYKRMTSWIHEYTEWKIFKHSCGAIEALISPLLDAGFDILNPVQISATGMDPQTIKDKYGDRAIFWGGGIDTQKVLPFGTPEDVKKQVRTNCEIFSKNGGFIFNPVHNVQALSPVDNIVAMFEEVKEINKCR